MIFDEDDFGFGLPVSVIVAREPGDTDSGRWLLESTGGGYWLMEGAGGGFWLME